LEKISAAKRALEQREEAINAGQPIDDKKQISFTDYDARIMKTKGEYEYSYNPQISVDKDQQIIVGQHVSQNPNDQQEVEPALVAIAVATDGQDKPEKQTLEDSNRQFVKGDLIYIKKEDSFQCPAGKKTDYKLK